MFCEQIKADDATGVLALLETGFSPNSTHSKSGGTALDMAAKSGRERILKTLLIAGANPNIAFDYIERASNRILKGRTALMHSATPAIARELLASGADANARDGAGFSALEHFILQRSQLLVSAVVQAVSDQELILTLSRLDSNHFKRIYQFSQDLVSFVDFARSVIRDELTHRASQGNH